MTLPAEEVPPELPEPALGINFARDGMQVRRCRRRGKTDAPEGADASRPTSQQKDWLSLVAVHSDAWLMAVAFYFGAKFDKSER